MAGAMLLIVKMPVAQMRARHGTATETAIEMAPFLTSIIVFIDRSRVVRVYVIN